MTTDLGGTRQPVTGLADADVEAELLQHQLLHRVDRLLLSGLQAHVRRRR
jgi:hypothetical protein